MGFLLGLGAASTSAFRFPSLTNSRPGTVRGRDHSVRRLDVGAGTTAKMLRGWTVAPRKAVSTLNGELSALL